MGVNGLWRLLQVSGRQIELRQLNGSVVAIDVSIWMIRIIHGMAAAGASSFQKGHLVGMIKRILYLLQNNIKPVFVFDGPAPALKQRTLQFRQQQRAKGQQNLQKMAEKYIVKLMERGVDFTKALPQQQQEQSDPEEEEPLVDSESEQLLSGAMDPEMQEIERQKTNDIMVLEYKTYRANHPRQAKQSESQFDAMSYEHKLAYIETVEEKLFHNKNKQHYKRANDVHVLQREEQDRQTIQRISVQQLHLYINTASNKEKIKRVKVEAAKQVESLKIQRLLDQYDDPESRALKEFFLANDDVEVKLNTLGVRDVYLQLSDPQQRKNLLALIYGSAKQQKAYKLKEWQLENQHQKHISERIKKRHIQKLQNQHEDLQYASDYEPECAAQRPDNLMEKYDTTNFDDMKNILASQLVEDESSHYVQQQIVEDQQQEQEVSDDEYQSVVQQLIENQSHSLPHVESSPQIAESKSQQVEIKSSQVNQFEEEEEEEQSLSRQSFHSQQSPQQQFKIQISDEIQSQQSKISLKAQQSHSVQELPDSNQMIPQSNQFLTATNEIMTEQNQIPSEVDLIKLIPEQANKLDHGYTQQDDALEETQQKPDSGAQKSNNFFEPQNQPQQPPLQQDSIFDDEQHQEKYPEISIDEMIQDILKYTNMNSLDFGTLQTKFDEVKYLLSIFGIPWVEAPGEAEAQCSYLQQEGLVDYVITDDSDAFLFGGSRVIKGLFDQRQVLEYYSLDQMEAELGLTKEKLIYLALFLGSDYTEGIRGVGIVNAMEIVEAFDSVEGLKRFAQWASRADILLQDVESHYENIPEKERIYKEYHKNYKKNWELPYIFPDQEIINGYLDPKLDKSKEKFTWAKPSLRKIEEFCVKQLEWREMDGKTARLMEALKQIQEQNSHAQVQITSYFKPDLSKKLAIIKSRRINDTVKNLISKDESRHQIQSKRKRQILGEIIQSDEKQKKVKRQKQEKPTIPIQLGDDDMQVGVIDDFQFIKKKPHKKKMQSD